MRNVINISLPATLTKQLKSEVKKGHYASTSEFFRLLLRGYMEEQTLHAQVAQSEEDFKQGNYKILNSLRDLR